VQYEEESTLTFDSRNSCGCADIKQRQVVEDALQAVQEQRDLADKYEELIYTLRADLENTKVMMDAAVKSKVRLRIQKAQETRKSQKVSKQAPTQIHVSSLRR
jgi:hypothetical protein